MEFSCSQILTETIINEGITIPACKDNNPLKVFSSKDPKAVVTVLFLEDIPVYYGPADGNYALFREAVHDSLSKFGKILNCAINKDKYDYFLGTGMVTLDCTVTDESNTLPELTHLIPWYSAVLEDTCDVKATWSTMKPYCRQCHEDGHARIDCPKRRKLIQCFNCNKHGHIARVCPRESKPTRKPKATKPKTQRAVAQQQNDSPEVEDTPDEVIPVEVFPAEVILTDVTTTEVTMTEAAREGGTPTTAIPQNLPEVSEQIRLISTTEVTPQKPMKVSEEVTTSAATEVTVIASDDEGMSGTQLSVATTTSAPSSNTSESTDRGKKPRSPLSPDHVAQVTKKVQKRKAFSSNMKTRSNEAGKQNNIDFGDDVDLSLECSTKQVTQHKSTTNDDGSSIPQ